MIVDIAWWDLDGSKETIESLKARVDDSTLARWSNVPGLREKHWIADTDRNRWGAIMLWDGERPAAHLMPPNDAQTLIGLPVAERLRFSVAASAASGEIAALMRTLEPAPPHANAHAASPAHASYPIDYIVVDAFTRTPLEGNPVAVFFVDDPLPAERMQRIAREMNLSEVVFVMPPKEGGDVHVRIFTPVNELPFAGHPLLGTAVALRHVKDQDRFVFETGMGLVPFDVRAEAPGVVYVTMQQPIPTWTRFEYAERLLEALGLDSSALPVEAYRNGPRHVFVTCPDVSALSDVRPDHRALAEFEDMSAMCLAPAEDHWRCRMFSPAYSVTEDAATGSAAGPIAIHLARYGLIPWGEPLHILQGVEIKRPSHMYALVDGSERGIESVKVSGHGVVVARGRLGV
ncbi:PhzF family phenazine biosynthesis protein [Trinickia violacea]|uniref:PhzF family phenazine biosynthesis protein n=1 Tax=Trinickia violacea TaxID=2571746 RepID=A0A4P8J109_9BURK|nr:PhzF family phenazine biosynthesis protein [Trinickia violacea]QCP53613.1 PhzF family phenazine biosynthesis protein [Trinickia violacea]